MKQLFAQYGFIIVMLLICGGSHFFMHRKGGHGDHGGHDEHNEQK